MQAKPTAIFTGPPNKTSSIFHRFHENHKTFLRGNPEKSCQNIIGFDANALYLYCMDQPMPTDHSSDDAWRTGFIPRSVIDTLSCLTGWTFSITVTGVRYNTNSIRVKKRNSDPIPWTVSTRRQIPSTNSTVVIITPTRAGSPNPSKTKNGSTRKDAKYKKTEKTTRYLRSLGHTVIEISYDTIQLFRPSLHRCKETIYDSATKN